MAVSSRLGETENGGWNTTNRIQLRYLSEHVTIFITARELEKVTTRLDNLSSRHAFQPSGLIENERKSILSNLRSWEVGY